VRVVQVVGRHAGGRVGIDTDHFSIPLRLFIYAASALPSGHFFKCLASLFGVVPKFLLFHHGEYGGHEEAFLVHVTVFCSSWLKFSFFLTELTESTNFVEHQKAGSWHAAVWLLLSIELRLLRELCVLCG
jgi:hypothetical protein